MSYSRNFGSLFPNKSINVGSHKNVDNTVAKLVSQYNSYMAAGDINSASILYEANKSVLAPYMIDMTYINLLEEEIYNTGLYALMSNDSIVSDEQPEIEQNIGSYWFQDY